MSSLMFVSSLPDLVMFLSLKVLKVCPHAPPPLDPYPPRTGQAFTTSPLFSRMATGSLLCALWYGWRMCGGEIEDISLLG